MNETFPKNKAEALTMLYLEQEDLSDKTVKDIVDLYISTYDEITDYLKLIHR